MSLLEKIKVRLKHCFINIIIKDNAYIVRTTLYKNGAIDKSETKTFEIEHKGEMPIPFTRYMLQYKESYRFYYCSFIFGGVSQGIVAHGNHDTLRKFNLDPASLSLIKQKNDDAIYASSNDIDTITDQFKEVGGVDMIYSPFVILEDLARAKQNDGCTLYLLNYDEFIAISVHLGAKLLFGVFFKTGSSEGIVDNSPESTTEEEFVEEEDDIGDLISLDDIDDVDDIDDFGDLDNIDSFEGGDDFAGFEGGDEDDSDDMVSLDDHSRDSENIGRDMVMLKYLKSSINEFYQNELYESHFIDKIEIFEASPISKEIIDYIENDLLLPLEISSIDILDEAVKLSYEEVYGG
jgi:hypothetical protein